MAPSPDPRPTAPASDEALAAPRRGYVGFSWPKFNETAIPILLVALIAGLMLFNFNEASDRMTRLEDRITRLEKNIDARITRLEKNIDARFTKLEKNIDARFTKLEKNIDAGFTKLETDIDARFAAVDARFTKLEDEIDARFTELEENQHEIAVTLARLVALLEASDEAQTAPSG